MVKEFACYGTECLRYVVGNDQLLRKVYKGLDYRDIVMDWESISMFLCVHIMYDYVCAHILYSWCLSWCTLHLLNCSCLMCLSYVPSDYLT